MSSDADRHPVEGQPNASRQAMLDSLRKLSLACVASGNTGLLTGSADVLLPGLGKIALAIIEMVQVRLRARLISD